MKRIVEAPFRDPDVAGTYSVPEEFLILLPDTDVRGAQRTGGLVDLGDLDIAVRLLAHRQQAERGATARLQRRSGISRDPVVSIDVP
jgi:hypothetical protein